MTGKWLALWLVAGAVLMPTMAGSRETQVKEGYWTETAQRTHARFTGKRGTFAQFGDSITVTGAFWTPLVNPPKNAPTGWETALKRVKAYLAPECWRDWKGPEYGSEGGKTTVWAEANIGAWLKKLNPETALIMFGTNDLHSMEVAEYRQRMGRLVQRCLDNGTVVILSTIPPRHGFEAKAKTFAEAVREIAREKQLALIDFYAEIIKRRPDDWDGALDKFKAYADYEVPTLLARDGVHPSFPKRFQDDYSPEGLRSSGYTLRNYLTLMMYVQVMDALQQPVPEKPKSVAALNLPMQAWFPKARPLPAPTGKVTRVANSDQLYVAVERAQFGEAILIADGMYTMPRPLDIKTDRVTLRSASGQREKVILDGGNEGELIRLTACSDVTIADLTVQNVRWNGIKLNSETGVQRATIYNCILHNIWQRAVKGTLVPAQRREQMRPKECRVQYCLFYNDRAKRFEDDSADTAENYNGNYIGGIDIMYPRDWTISDNVFVGIKGRTGEARGAVFLWHEAEGCVVEKNIIMDCDSGICLGNAFRNAETKVHATRCIVRNNFLTRVPENGVFAAWTRDCALLHNTVYDPESRQGRLIRLVHDNEGVRVLNNLLCGAPLRNEGAGQMTLRNNLAKVLSGAFVAPDKGDLHLTAQAVEAIDKAEPLAEVKEDIGGKPRGAKPDLGAHEF